MLIWGTKRTERHQGVVADFCPICRRVCAFDLTRVGVAGHIYFVSFGQGSLAGFTIHCRSCDSTYGAQPTRYAAIEKDSGSDLETLIRNTFPRLHEIHGARLELEAKLKRSASALTPEQRRDMLIEPFTLTNPAVEARLANSGEFDRRSGLGCLGTVLVGGGLFFGAIVLKGRAKDAALLAAAILGGIGILYTLVQMHLAPKRFVRSTIIPRITRALAPLRPTQEEIQDCLERCRTLGWRMGKVAKLKDVWPGLERRMAGLDG